MSGYLSHAMMALQEAIDTAQDGDAAASKHTLIMFGVAALTLDAARADQGFTLPNPIESERDQFIALAYMLRCAPAHDISEPRWKINERYRRAYTVGDITIDLSDHDSAPFEFSHIYGPRTICQLASYAQARGWA